MNSNNKLLPINVCLLALNEGPHLREILPELKKRVAQITIIDSYSCDDTIDCALAADAYVVQRKFTNFGDQWNFALSVPTDQPWTMKLDPDERPSDELWESIREAVESNSSVAGYTMSRRLWFMGKPLHVSQKILRLWKTGTCRFTDVLVNEHPIVEGPLSVLEGFLEHLDSRDLHHWTDKQNYYSSMEAITAFEGRRLAAEPKLWGSSIQRRMWMKKNFFRIPFRYQLMGLGLLIGSGAWRDGKLGLVWVRMRLFTRRMREYKLREMKTTGHLIDLPKRKTGEPDSRVEQAQDA